ncbi:RWD domain-containing protein 1 [Halotydeus destructor]|nr:RWD domain-containing protein 1 [Halotydeus destructor]
MMLNHSEEQENELEALEAIYPNELTVLSRPPEGKFQIRFECEVTEDEEEEYYVSLQFEYTKRYPEEVPIFEILETSDSLTEADETALLERITEEAHSNVGMVMIFMIVSAGQEWLNERKDNAEQMRRDEAERKVKAAEEAEQKRFEGTRVTVDTFMKWKIAFDKELALLSGKDKDKDKKVGKMSGRKLFESDARLIESDLQFLEEGDVAVEVEDVKVDESLFESIDDLDIEGLSDED